MQISSRARWARLLGTAVLGGVLTAGVLATAPAQAADFSPFDGSGSFWSFYDNSFGSTGDANGVDFESDGAESFGYGYGFGADGDRLANGV